MKLYYSPGACSLSPHIALCEAGADFTLVRVNLQEGKTEHGIAVSSISPKGYVPILELDNGTVITEGPAIVQYIADQYPAAGLAPVAGTLERAQLQEWLNFISTELHKSFSPLFRNAVAEWQAAATQSLQRRFSMIAQHLNTNPYLMGAHFSVADAYLFTVLNWAKPVKFDLSPWPVFTEYMARIRLRPKVQEALKAEGLQAL